MTKQIEKMPQKNYTTVALAEDAELARDYVEMLSGNEIPARLLVNGDLVQGSRVLIQVPEDLIEQAQSLIRAKCSGPDFYDYVFDDGRPKKNEEVED
jgi:hypothetical protein